VSLPVAILAGGLGTRLQPITEKIPKSLVRVAGKPFIVHQLELLRRNGVSHAVLCVGAMGEMIEAELGDGHALGVRLSYSFDGAKLLGTAGALKRALRLLGDAFFVLYGDSYLDIDYQAAARAFRKAGKLGLLTVYRNRGLYDRSNIVFTAGRIVQYDKAQVTPEMEYIDYGLGVLRDRALDQVPEDEPYDLADLYRELVARDQLAALEVDRRFYEIGSPEGLAQMDAMISGSVLSGRKR
jgi:NDP-sugar pyrophosphorylase family protein